ncbi:hypothetical protein [Lysinibacillus sp. F5]|uniref:hypothetical protein n=1 Tax=Lysinibacillus sp. F5 TaxID=1700846 RepID=UPI0007388AFD|nr:hypothetical protein [Lysinibacillus sp. F5]KUF29974.1 hypothetical protein AK833_18085 [Lysinibacillus sp. F5]
MKQAKLIEEVTQIATLKAIEVFNAQKEEELQREKDKRLHNTKLLLKHYQEFKLYTDKTRGANSSRLSADEKNILATITFGEREEIINSIKETTKRTVAMVEYIDKALETLEFMYKQEKNERDYNILKKRYMESWTIPKLSEFYHMHERSVYKVLDSVAERLSVLLFGIYGVDK